MVKKSRKQRQDLRSSLIQTASSLLMIFGGLGFYQGRSVPWGYAQKAGIAMFALGLVLQISILRSRPRE